MVKVLPGEAMAGDYGHFRAESEAESFLDAPGRWNPSFDPLFGELEADSFEVTKATNSLQTKPTRRASSKMIPGLPRVQDFKRKEDRVSLDSQLVTESERLRNSAERRLLSKYGLVGHTTQTRAISLNDALTEEELGQRWILNLSRHPRESLDREKDREKLFIDYREDANLWRRVTVSLDYRNAPPDSLEANLLQMHSRRSKSDHVLAAIRDSLGEILFYDTTTNLRMRTEEDGLLHVHVQEDLEDGGWSQDHLPDQPFFTAPNKEGSESTSKDNVRGGLRGIYSQDLADSPRLDPIPGLPTTDLIFVHGLHGASFQKWSKRESEKEKSLWPRDLLSAFSSTKFSRHMWRESKKQLHTSGVKQYFVEGSIQDTMIEALPDSGASLCLISPALASQHGLNPDPDTKRIVKFANKKTVESPGMVEVPWRFAADEESHLLKCWILPGCIHDLILGSQFLRATQTLTKFVHRVKSRITSLPKRLRLNFLGDENQRLWGLLDGHPTAALPDTGSDVMLISSDYACKLGLLIDHNYQNWLEVEFADGSTAWTSGIVKDIPWNVGGRTLRCDFHVFDDLSVDVIVSKDYLFDENVFSEHSESFFDGGFEELSYLCNIRLIGRYGDALNLLEEEYFEDMTSPDAFGPEMVQRELARRDLIRDEIATLAQDHRESASQAEKERQHQWQQHKISHPERWKTMAVPSSRSPVAKVQPESESGSSVSPGRAGPRKFWVSGMFATWTIRLKAKCGSPVKTRSS